MLDSGLDEDAANKKLQAMQIKAAQTKIRFDKLKTGLTKTRANFTDRMEDLVGASVDLDEDFMDEEELDLIYGGPQKQLGRSTVTGY